MTRTSLEFVSTAALLKTLVVSDMGKIKIFSTFFFLLKIKRFLV